MNESNRTEHVQKLIGYASSFSNDILHVSMDLLDNPKFNIWSGSSKPNQHHYGTFGLAKHTLEVVDLCFSVKKTLSLDEDDVEIYLSSLFHDSGKMYDYTLLENGEYEDNIHKRKIHHISRSALIWSHAVSKYPDVASVYHDSVLHNILSHHGQISYGSPVGPHTRVAWMLHLCDNLSARLNDCDKIDLFGKDRPK